MMTSIEALDILVGIAGYHAQHLDKEEIKEYNEALSHYEDITNGLEILEIIKKWSFIQDNYKEGYGTFTQFLCNIHTIGMKEDFEKVKEWLEREISKEEYEIERSKYYESK